MRFLIKHKKQHHNTRKFRIVEIIIVELVLIVMLILLKILFVK